MDATDISSFKKLFIDTAKGHVESMRGAVAQLLQNNSNQEAMNQFYIASHSVKGESLAMGYMGTGALAQLLEKIFHAAKDGKILLTPELLDGVKKAIDKLSASLDSIEKEDKECVLNDERLLLESLSGISLDTRL